MPCVRIAIQRVGGRFRAERHGYAEELKIAERVSVARPVRWVVAGS